MHMYRNIYIPGLNPNATGSGTGSGEFSVNF